jgi:hypothetical protein
MKNGRLNAHPTQYLPRYGFSSDGLPTCNHHHDSCCAQASCRPSCPHLIIFIFVYQYDVFHILHLVCYIWRALCGLVADWLLLLLLLLLLACLAQDMLPQAAWLASYAAAKRLRG